jgi:hypothetical protein
MPIPKRKFTKKGAVSPKVHQSKDFMEFYLRFLQAANLEYKCCMGSETNVGNSQQQKSTLYLDFVGANN